MSADHMLMLLTLGGSLMAAMVVLFGLDGEQ
jgi:hypothetical protein